MHQITFIVALKQYQQFQHKKTNQQTNKQTVQPGAKEPHVEETSFKKKKTIIKRITTTPTTSYSVSCVQTEEEKEFPMRLKSPTHSELDTRPELNQGSTGRTWHQKSLRSNKQSSGLFRSNCLSEGKAKRFFQREKNFRGSAKYFSRFPNFVNLLPFTSSNLMPD